MREHFCAPKSVLRRHGITLVELLIVMAILTILATLSLTTVRGLLKDQKVTQSARMVEQYFETAKLRAITNGRPVAVFLERVALEGGAAGAPVEANYTVTRLSLGEVFPAYSGDIVNAQGQLWDVDFMLNSSVPGGPYPDRASRGGSGAGVGDGFADQIRIDFTSVFSGFGTPTEPGMIAVGDTIEFPAYSRRFVIERIDAVTGQGGVGQVAVTFFNPPSPTVYNPLLNPVNFPRILEPSYSTTEPSLDANGAVAPGINGSTEFNTAAPPSVDFRIYRRPTKSMLGAITLPRGTCIDLYASGVGPSASAADGNFTPFFCRSGHPTLSGVAPGFIPTAAAPDTPSRSSFSRVGIVFDETGRVSGIFRDDKIIGSSGLPQPNGYYGFDANSVLHLLIGRSDQVLIDPDSNNESAFRMARATNDDRDQVRANILDPNNAWISVNPLTGLITTSPVNQVADATLSAAVTNADYAAVVSEARRLSTVGVNNAGK